MLALHHNLQIRRIPFFSHDGERLVVTYLPGGNGPGIARALGSNSVDRLGSERFLFYVRVVVRTISCISCSVRVAANFSIVQDGPDRLDPQGYLP